MITAANLQLLFEIQCGDGRKSVGIVVLRAECAGRGTEILLHVAGEVALRGEAVHVGDVGQREALVAQQAGDVDGGVAVDPEGRRGSIA